MTFTMDRGEYASLYGPTEGDRIRLGDTNLVARIEKTYIPPGDEAIIGAGRNVRDGMATHVSPIGDSPLDAVVESVVVIDPTVGIVKADIGIKDGRIVGIGRAGNPDMQDDVDMVIDTNTTVLPTSGLIATPGFIDPHVHLLTGALVDMYLQHGYTTLIGDAMWDIGTNPSWTVERMFDAFAGIPVNTAIISRASSGRAPLERMLHSGVTGFKIHEDGGANPAVIDNTLSVADDFDVQIMLHTDTINEATMLEDTLSAIAGRTIHAYHVEGAGGGHAPDLIEVVREPHILCSSTNPTNPYTTSALREHTGMIMAVHLLNPDLPDDVAIAQSRVRGQTMAAEDVLHDMGAIAMISSDSVGMGRNSESARRALQVAHAMKAHFGRPEGAEDDNDRILRYVAKFTINPAIAQGLAHEVGSLQPGKLADIVLWKPAFFGVKPEMVFKDGFQTYANTGTGNGSTPFVEPVMLRPMWGNMGDAPRKLGHMFVARATYEDGGKWAPAHRSRMLCVKNTRAISTFDMVRNDVCPDVRVNRESLDVSINGQIVNTPPASTVALSRKYLLL